MTSQITLSKPTTQFSSISDWAKAVGSSAKTHAGQRKAIIASFADSPLPARNLRRLGRMERNQETYQAPSKWFAGGFSSNYRGDKAGYLNSRERSRQERFAASCPLTLSMPAPATEADCEGSMGGGNRVSLLDLQSAPLVYKSYARAGEWYVRCSEDASYDNHRYSNSWHNAHGGAKTVEARTVHIRRVRPDGTLETRDQQVNAWRGNFLINALIDAGIVESHKGLNHVRLHAAFSLAILRQGRALTIYERTLAGEHVDYVAVAGKATFHAASIKEAIAGLRRKLHASATGTMVTFALGRKLGFCDAGMRAFAADFDLDTSRAYTPAEIAERVKSNLAAAAPYETELHKLAQAVNYKIKL